MNNNNAHYADAAALAKAILAKTGKRVVLALPLGLGKANHIANALFMKAVGDASISLDIFTALTLEQPPGRETLQRRFLDPIAHRLFGDYPALEYAKRLRDGTLPDNIRVNEFFFSAGHWLGVERAQREYISANYTHAIDYLLDRGVNVVAQLVAKNENEKKPAYSLSCNPDITLDLLKRRKNGEADFIFAAQVNSELPFMDGDAQIDCAEAGFVLDSPETDFELFSVPRLPISLEEQAMGIHVARLIPDNGTLQIGIGSLGDAVTRGLIVRHNENARFKELVQKLAPGAQSGLHHDEPFQTGLHGVSEMFVNGFLELAKHGILKREVDDAVLHAAFFVESREFYKSLRDMPPEQRAKFQMKAVSFTNELYGEEEAKRAARINARFINNAMMATLLGAVVSDGVENGNVVSGVGGQYNFVAQAFALKGARSVITLNATRRSKGETVSNIRWSYGHDTIPRHLRDLVVTEYGAADLRGKSDEDVIIAMLSVTGARFQDALLDEAKRNRKIRKTYSIPESFRRNTPEHIYETLAPARDSGLLPSFPFGSEYSETEQVLLPALKLLKENAGAITPLAKLFLTGLTAGAPTASHKACLERMQLDKPSSLSDYVYRKLLLAALTGKARG